MFVARFRNNRNGIGLEHDPEKWTPVSRLREVRSGGRRKVGKDYAKTTSPRSCASLRPVDFHRGFVGKAARLFCAVAPGAQACRQALATPPKSSAIGFCRDCCWLFWRGQEVRPRSCDIRLPYSCAPNPLVQPGFPSGAEIGAVQTRIERGLFQGTISKLAKGANLGTRR
jgi:hypothetical protein